MKENFDSVLSEVQRRIQEKGLPKLQGTYRFELGGAAYHLAQGAGGNYALLPSDSRGTADCTLHMTKDDFVYFVRSPGKVLEAVLNGRIRIQNTPKAIELAWALQTLLR